MSIFWPPVVEEKPQVETRKGEVVEVVRKRDPGGTGGRKGKGKAMSLNSS